MGKTPKNRNTEKARDGPFKNTLLEMCPECHGDGKVKGHECPRCKGSGISPVRDAELRLASVPS
jgi:DnaJ-class molecular chaperone